jgi:phosphonate transport system substrate-binding protein
MPGAASGWWTENPSTFSVCRTVASQIGKMKHLIIALILLGLTPEKAWSQNSGTSTLPAKVVVALKPDKDPDALLLERRSLAALLSAELNRPVEVIVPLSGAVIVEGLANGTIDVAYVSATDLLNARKSGAGSLLLAGEIDGKTWYRSYWVCLKEKPYQSVADLRNQPIAFSSRTSTSGYIFPLYDLRRKGLISEKGNPEEFFGKGHVWFGSGYVSAIERVLRGEAEAAAVSYYVLDQDKHLTLEQRNQLRKLAEQGPVPTHVLAVSRKISGAARDQLKSALLALNKPEHQSLRDRAFVSKLVETDEEKHLAPLMEALALAGQNK